MDNVNPQNTHSKLATSLKAACDGISSNKISDLCGISSPYIRQMWTGRANFTSDALSSVLDAAEKLKPGAISRFGMHLAGTEIDPSKMTDSALMAWFARVTDEVNRRAGKLISIFSNVA
jgi:hypothetical protein